MHCELTLFHSSVQASCCWSWGLCTPRRRQRSAAPTRSTTASPPSSSSSPSSTSSSRLSASSSPGQCWLTPLLLTPYPRGRLGRGGPYPRGLTRGGIQVWCNLGRPGYSGGGGRVGGCVCVQKSPTEFFVSLIVRNMSSFICIFRSCRLFFG